MAFPTISTVLDNFNRGDGAIGANWSAAPLNNAFPAFDILSNTARPPNSGNQMWWNVAQYGPDCEARVTLSTFDTTSNAKGVAFFARLVNPSASVSTCNGYIAFFYINQGDASHDTIEIGKYTNSVYAQLGISTTTMSNLATGDELGFELIGTSLKAWRKPSGGAWGTELTVTDATYSAAGFVGLHGDNAAFRVDDFTGGTINTVPNTFPPANLPFMNNQRI